MLRVVEGTSSEIVTIHSPVLGRLEVGLHEILTFTEPVAGFPDCLRYALLPYALAGREDLSMGWLQAVDPPFHTFLVTDPWDAVPEYQPEIADSEVKAVGAREFAQTSVLGILTVGRASRELTINLQAPILVNPGEHLAKQVLILNGGTYSPRARVCDLP